MKTLLILLLSVISIQAATIEIPETAYRFEYDSKAWDFLPKSAETKGLWAFSDHLLYLGAALTCLDSGASDGIDAKNMAMSMSAGYDKTEEMKPVAGLKTLKFTNSKEKKIRCLSYLVEEKYTLFIYVEGDSPEMISRESAVLTFLSGLKK